MVEFPLSIQDFAQVLSFTEAFGTSFNVSIQLFVSSLVLGLMCLFSYYTLFHRSDYWSKSLGYVEKTILSFVVGFLTIIVSAWATVFLKAFFDPFNLPEMIFTQILLMMPFAYFFFYALIYNQLGGKNKKTDLDFAKNYIKVSTLVFINFNVLIITLMVFYVGWGLGLVWVSLVCLISLEVFKYIKEHQ